MNWKSDARKALFAYPKILAKKRDAINVSVTANYSGMPGAHNASRTTENAALKAGLTEREEIVLEAVENALRIQSYYANGAERQKFVELKYFRRTHTLYGAACELHYSEETVKAWNTQILTAVYAGIIRPKNL